MGTVGGRFEEGDTCVGMGRHCDAEGSPGGAGVGGGGPRDPSAALTSAQVAEPPGGSQGLSQ